MSFDLALIDSDLEINSDGTIKTVTGADKLKQDIVKIILTPIGSVRYHPWYGSSVGENMIGQIIPENVLNQELSSALLDSLNRLQVLQRAQAANQRVTLSELIASVQDIAIQRSAIDSRQVHVIVKVIAKDYNAVEEEFVISP